MAWRPNPLLVNGELDNIERGRVVGWIRFLGLPEVVTLNLKGDFHRDIRGAKIAFRNRHPRVAEKAENYMEGFSLIQTGEAGDITAGQPPYDYGKEPYIEWYSHENGRVVIEPEADDVLVIGNVRDRDNEKPIDRDKQNELMADFLAGIVVHMSTAGR